MNAGIVPAPFSPPTLTPVTADWMRTRAPQLALDLCMGLASPDQLATEYGLTSAQWDYVRLHPVFIEALAAAEQTMNSTEGVAERIRRKAAMVLDRVGVMTMAEVLSNPKAADGVKLNAFDSLVTAAGLGKGSTNVGTGALAGALIQINVNSERGRSSVVVGDAPVIEGSKP